MHLFCYTEGGEPVKRKSTNDNQHSKMDTVVILAIIDAIVIIMLALIDKI